VTSEMEIIYKENSWLNVR